MQDMLAGLAKQRIYMRSFTSTNLANILIMISIRHRCPKQGQVNTMLILWQYSGPVTWVNLVDSKFKYEPHYGVHYHNTAQSVPDIIIEGDIYQLPSSNWVIRYRLCSSSVCQYRLVRYLIREFWPMQYICLTMECYYLETRNRNPHPEDNTESQSIHIRVFSICLKL